MPGFNKPYKLDVSSRSGGILVYIRRGIFSRPIKLNPFPSDIQLIALELRFGSEKWAFVSIYRPPTTQTLSYFLENLENILDDLYSIYSKVIILGDFNSGQGDLQSFLDDRQMVNLINVPTCFKSLDGTCIDLILTNSKSRLSNCGAVETGLSDHHLMIYGFFKCRLTKLPPVKISYRNYKNFNQTNFENELSRNLSDENNIDYDRFQHIFETTLDIYAPLKTKLIRGDSKPHFNRQLRKEIMKRSHLKNIANKSGNEEDKLAYKRQRNLVVKLNKKQKRLFFNEVNDESPKQSLWDLCKPYMGKFSSEDKFLLLDPNTDTAVSDEFQIATMFNDYYCNIKNILKISYWEPIDQTYITVLDPVDKCILKYINHPSILKIQEYF